MAVAHPEAAPYSPRPKCVVIDAEQKFLAREMHFLRLIAIGYPFKTSGGAKPINLANERARRVGEPDMTVEDAREIA